MLKVRKLEEVVVTASRTERQVGALPMPVTLVSKQQIQQSGSLRLGDILREQTGLALVNDHGQGLQVQRFNDGRVVAGPGTLRDYTLNRGYLTMCPFAIADH